MRRTGKRGEGKFERISWDEALDTVAGELNRVRGTYGPSALLFLGGGGDTMELHRQTLVQGLLYMTGGCTRMWGVASNEGALFASMATYGTLSSVGDPDDFLNSRLIIMWGWDPTTTIQRTNTSWYLLQARERGTRIISVDARYTPATATLADQWIPIIPGTDAAMLIAMAYVIINENLQNRAFLEKYTSGFDQFRDYVLGIEDSVAKTPVWAEGITGVPAAVTESLAREYATTKPAALISGIGPGRTAYGEQYHRAAHALDAMTGNIGIHGGWAGAFYHITPMFGGYDFKLGRLPAGKENAVEAGVPPRRDSLPTLAGSDNAARIHFSEIPEAILKGKAGGYPADLKMLFVVTNNPVNQHPNSNKWAQALQNLESVVVVEQVMTATARFADILLPQSTYMERNDIIIGGAIPVYTCVNKAIEPLYESKSLLEICNLLATRLGVSVYSQKTEEEWLREITRGSYIPDYDAFKKKGIYPIKLLEPGVAFKKQIEDIENNPFPTPSGKIEIYSQKLAEMSNPELPPVPKYIEPWEGRHDRLRVKYPLQLITTHFKRRAHSQFDRVPWLRELMPQAISINPIDARARGISDGDTVRVFNDRGELIIPAIVTERVMPGVVDLPQGAWFSPDARGIDRGGCANTLTRDAGSPGGAACHNTALVQLQKA